ncbi:hypothetical protein AF72_12155 [Xylella taiwanensis]|uniref:Uncharacterized protein n=1 Tax=Xylella taiwanensis TaxID=1444770 RepID=Z9JFJ8_9GAMM|nr:hypothetical protein AF72_12155 [Xylella taiwanensis]
MVTFMQVLVLAAVIITQPQSALLLHEYSGTVSWLEVPTYRVGVYVRG